MGIALKQIESIEILGLHRTRNVRIPFRGRHCVMIGPNGSGKSTALQIIAYGLGRQWRALAQLNFESVSYHFQGGRTAVISREECLEFVAASRRGAPHLRSSYFESVVADNLFVSDVNDPDEMHQIALRLGISPSELRTYQRRMTATPGGKAAQKRVKDFTQVLVEMDVPLTMYFPTYRRIELELKKLFENVPETYRRTIEAAQGRTPKEGFITEIVRFGMEDITGKIAAFERETRDFARDQFNRMMASYIKEMANSQVLSVRELRDLHVDKETINLTLSRIEEGLLDPGEKEKISSIILDMSSGQAGGHPPFYKKWLVHFFAKLHAVNQEIEAKESALRGLIRTLSRYLEPKRLGYNIERYHFYIEDEKGNELSLGDLSSGEKQIISLLTEIYFRADKFNFLIDEPELSLSVPWQTEILADVVKSPHSNQIIAVTHSPFIYDNALQGAVVDFSRVTSDT